MENNKRIAFALPVLFTLLCVTLAYCAWSGYYLNGDWVSGLIGGIIGCSIAAATGYLLAYSISK